MLFRIRKSKAAGSTPLSRFVRTASSGEKKKIYVVALKKASDAQNSVISQVALRKTRRLSA